MILTCPECATRYQANDAAFLPAGRRVRCAKCGHSWHQEPPLTEPEVGVEEIAPLEEPIGELQPMRASFSQPQPEPAGEPPVPQKIKSMGWLVVAGGWLGLLVVVLAIGWAAVSYREQVQTLWPQSATLYSVLGLPVNVSGLAFTDVSYRREKEDKQTVLAVSGKLANISSRELAVPAIAVILKGDDGRELYRWNFTPDVATLKAGQSVKFLTRLSSPPAGAHHLELKFADPKG